MPFIEVIEHQDATGKLKEIYDDLLKTRGKLAEVHKIQSLNPKSIEAHMQLYLQIMFRKSPLQRWQREMIAVVVSAANNCRYCIRHHAEALNFFWKDLAKTEVLANDYRQLELSPADQLLCKMAWHLTKTPDHDGKRQLVNQLKSEGLSDRAILDATLIISYFNFVNRIVMNLGVELEADGGTGYKYD